MATQLLMGGERLQLGQVRVVEAGRLVGVASDHGVDLRERLGRGERGAARRSVGSHRDDPVDPHLGGGGDELGVRGLTQVQVGVAVDHRDSGVGGLRFGNSGSRAPTDAPGASVANVAAA